MCQIYHDLPGMVMTVCVLAGSWPSSPLTSCIVALSASPTHDNHKPFKHSSPHLHNFNTNKNWQKRSSRQEIHLLATFKHLSDCCQCSVTCAMYASVTCGHVCVSVMRRVRVIMVMISVSSSVSMLVIAINIIISPRDSSAGLSSAWHGLPADHHQRF